MVQRYGIITSHERENANKSGGNPYLPAFLTIAPKKTSFWGKGTLKPPLRGGGLERVSYHLGRSPPATGLPLRSLGLCHRPRQCLGWAFLKFFRRIEKGLLPPQNHPLFPRKPAFKTYRWSDTIPSPDALLSLRAKRYYRFHQRDGSQRRTMGAKAESRKGGK